MPLLDIIQFTRELPTRRNKAALLLTPDLQAQRSCAEQIATAAGAVYFDVLDHFQSDATLAKQLAGFSPDDFFKLLSAQKSPLLIVSGIEFLLASWISQGDAKQVKVKFCQQIELRERPPAFLLVVQQDPVLASYKPKRHTGQLVIELSQTLALT
jgi:hypothetical protein